MSGTYSGDFTEADLADPEHPAVVAALAIECKICGAATDEVCRNIVTGGPLTSRVVHRARVPIARREDAKFQ